MRLLLVEDDELLGDGICNGLRQYGYTVDWIRNGISAQTALLTEHFDIILLDLGLPGKSGLEVLAKVRSNQVDTPVIIITARDTIDDRVKGLDSGADIYMVKPIDLDELCANVRALQRRSGARTENLLTLGNVTLDPEAHKVFLGDEEVAISRREFSLLFKLLDRIGKVLTRDQLSQALYGWGDDVDSNAIEVHIHNLRKKFKDALNIRTVRGVGYMIDKD